MNRLIEGLCFGQAPGAFLRQELSLSPEQKRIALRIFSLLMLFAVIEISTRMPSGRVAAFFIPFIVAQAQVTTRQCLDGVVLNLKLFAIAIAGGIFLLTVFQDEGWFLLPVGTGLVVLMVFYARRMRLSNLAAIFFASIVFYSPHDPVQGVESALWDSVFLAGSAVLASFLIATVLWPETSFDVMRQQIRRRLNSALRLTEAEIMLLRTGTSTPINRIAPGWTSGTLKHLDDAARDQATLSARKPTWTHIILEVGVLEVGAGALYDATSRDDLSPQQREEEIRVLETFRATLRGILMKLRKKSSRRLEHLETSLPNSSHPRSQQIIRNLHSLNRLLDFMDDLHHPVARDQPARSEQGAESEFPHWLESRYWELHQNTLLWSLKVGLACMATLLLVQGMNAFSVDTAIITTIIVADSTLGADYRKSIMRLLGATMGAILGYAWMVLAQPMADTVAGLLITAAPPFALCAWIGAAGPRVSYVGVQMGLAFSFLAFQDFQPNVDLATGWARILGIFLGISVMGIFDYLLWPARSVDYARTTFAYYFDQVRSIILRDPRAQGLTLEISAAMLRRLDEYIRDAFYSLDFARMEPGSGETLERERIERTIHLGRCVAQLTRINARRHRFFLSDGSKGAIHEIQGPLGDIRLVYAEECALFSAVFRHEAEEVPESRVPETFRRLVAAFEERWASGHFEADQAALIRAFLDLEQRYVSTWVETHEVVRTLLDERRRKGVLLSG